MNLRKLFEEENGYSAMAVRQDYAGQTPYEDGFCDEYVEWLEKRNNVEAVKIGLNEETDNAILFKLMNNFIKNKANGLCIDTSQILINIGEDGKSIGVNIDWEDCEFQNITNFENIKVNIKK